MHIVGIVKKYMFVVLVCFFGTSIVANNAIPSKHSQRHIDKQAQEYKKLLDACLKPLSCSMHESEIIGKNERDELQLAWLAEKLNKTKTVFGRWALEHSLHPVSDLDIIYARQLQLQKLVNDPKLYSRIGAHLETIKHAENCLLDWNTYNHEVTDEQIKTPVFGGLLAYWDRDQYRDSEKLFHAIEGLYYSLPGTKFLNKYTSALEASMFLETGKTAAGIGYIFGMQGITQEWSNYQMMLDGDDTEFNLARGVKNGFNHVAADFNPKRTDKSENYDTSNSKSFNKCFLGTGASWGDRYHAFKMYYNSDTTMNCYFLGKMLHYVPLIGRKFTQSGGFKVNTTGNKDPGIATKATAATVASGFAVYPLYFKYLFTRQFAGHWSVLFQGTRRLQRHMVQVMRELRAIVSLRAIVHNTPELASSCVAKHLHDVFDNASPGLRELFLLAGSSTFSADSFIFSRGRVLHAHRLLKQVRDELAPALQAMGELDAMHTMATHYKENLGSSTPYSFVQFEDHKEAMVSFKDCWIPVLEDAVSNSVEFGNDHPNKLIITGPNGGGKSTFLKALGHGVVLAQSWGIAPASEARMTVIDNLYTCLHPQESLKDAMSTFMAEKYRVDQITKNVQMHRSGNKKIMLLLDEPFKGTVDAESAERIYNFGMQVAGLSGSIVCIATHVHKPIMLAKDTNSAFSNYHVVISEPIPGQFKREFRLEEGVAHWWFDDIAKRSRFVDWLGEKAMELRYEKAAQVV